MADRFRLILAALVTAALMAYGFVLHPTDPSTGNLIIGAVIGYWLREGEGQARRLATEHRDTAGHHDPGTTSP